MKLGVLFSGGKDSCLAWQLASEEHEVVCLVSMRSLNPDSYMFHTPNAEWTSLQAEAAGMPLLIQETEGIKEKELEELTRAIKKAKVEHKIEGIVTGAVRSEYQASRIKQICDSLGLQCINPLWHMDQVGLLEKLQEKNIHAIIIAVASEPFTREWLGRPIDEKFIEDIKRISHLANPAGEGGEYESFVVDMPLFEKKIEITNARKEYANYVGKYILEDARLCEK